MSAQYSEYEYRVAMALASNPGLACFDDIDIFSMQAGPNEPEPESLWELPTVSMNGEVEKVDDYDAGTARVDVFQVSLLSAREASVRRRPFRFYPAVRVVSRQLRGFMPSADLILVDAFPLTRDIVLNAVRTHLLRTEYAKEQNTFLWGHDVVEIRTGSQE